jgi:hypothetical protein
MTKERLSNVLNSLDDMILDSNYPACVIGDILGNITGDADKKEYSKLRRWAIEWANKHGILINVDNF